MPSSRAHDADADKTGYSRLVNRIIDLPYAWLGRGHRVLFHTPFEAALIGYIVDGPKGAKGGLRHFVIDRLASEDRTLKAYIELSARMNKPKTGTIRVNLDPPVRKYVGKLVRRYTAVPKYDAVVADNPKP